jgi:hypothetical protein
MESSPFGRKEGRKEGGLLTHPLKLLADKKEKERRKVGQQTIGPCNLSLSFSFLSLSVVFHFSA